MKGLVRRITFYQCHGRIGGNVSRSINHCRCTEATNQSDEVFKITETTENPKKSIQSNKNKQLAKYEEPEKPSVKENEEQPEKDDDISEEIQRSCIGSTLHRAFCTGSNLDRASSKKPTEGCNIALFPSTRVVFVYLELRGKVVENRQHLESRLNHGPGK